MSGSRPENPDVNAQDVTFPETVPDPVEPDCDPVDEGCNPKTGFEPGTEMVPEKGISIPVRNVDGCQQTDLWE